MKSAFWGSLDSQITPFWIHKLHHYVNMLMLTSSHGLFGPLGQVTPFVRSIKNTAPCLTGLLATLLDRGIAVLSAKGCTEVI